MLIISILIVNEGENIMNVNIFLILMIVLIGIVGIVISLLCASIKTEKMGWSIFISFCLFSVIVASFMIISVSQLYKAKNINTYNIEVVRVQDTDKQDWSGKAIKYTDIAGNENEAVISDTKYDTDSTYIEMKRYKWWFLYEDNNVLHIKLNQ